MENLLIDLNFTFEWDNFRLRQLLIKNKLRWLLTLVTSKNPPKKPLIQLTECAKGTKI